MGTSISQIITVTTPALGVAPTPATGLTVSNLSTTSLTLSWTAPSGGTAPFAYQPQMSLGAGPPVWTNYGGSISTTTVPLIGLAPNSAYQFQVVTSNLTGNSVSAAAAATTLAIGPSAPTGLSVFGTPTQTTVVLQWNAPTTGTIPFTYQVLSRTPTGSGIFTAIGTPTAGLTTTISGLAVATGYDFEVIASNLAGSSLPSAVLTGVQTAGSIANLPGPATGLAISAVTATTLTFSWIVPSTGGAGPFLYQPLVAQAGSSPVWTNIGSTISATTVPVTGLAPNTAYQFEVLTLNIAGSSTSSTVSATTLAVVPSAPTALAVVGTSTQTSIALQWTAPAAGTAPITYQVLSRTPTGSGAFTAAAASTVGLTQTITGLLPSTGYDFEVVASNLAGTGAASTILLNAQTASGSLGNAPGPATGLILSAVATTSLTLSWTAPSTGTLPFSYQPQVSLAGIPNWSNIGGSISATTVASTGLIPNTAYQFQILTSNSVSSSTSATASATTLSVLPAAPTGLTAGAVTQTTVALSWTTPATGTTPFTYQVLSRSPSGSGAFAAAAATTSGTTLTITGLTASTSYDFEVTAANLAGTGPASAILSNIITTAVAGVAPSAPTNLTAGGAITQSTMPVSWTAPAVGTPQLSYVVQYRPTPGITPPPGSRIVAPLTGTVTAGSWVTNQSITVGAMPNGFMRYNYLLPQGYSTNFIYPILFYGHQNDEGMNGSTYPADGANLVNQTVINGTFNTVAFRTNYPCIVVVPECDQTLDLSGANGNANFGGYADTPNSGGNEQGINALLAQFKTNFSVDPTRCYCTGDSLGAIGSLAWIVDNNRVNGVNKLWTAAMGLSDQLFRPSGVPNATVFANMRTVPYIAVSTPNDNNQAIYDQAGWTFYTGNTNYPTPAQYAASGVAAMKAGTNSFWYMLDPTGVPWDTYRQLNADGGQATALYNLLFSFII